ncbi:hypothetical protein DAEQUDRAFT_33518 [Daedalea quercina L-15889]|uniref:Uncharacterized protein n=1 Tax=Daedalea quercina L-15889 TaxID=1314783 RepID=A0A165SRC2_9APHY|nr:hypothetical protein DAEQUDRAFT_33518 [Daedalea quercina L-15889]
MGGAHVHNQYYTATVPLAHINMPLLTDVAYHQVGRNARDIYREHGLPVAPPTTPPRRPSTCEKGHGPPMYIGLLGVQRRRCHPLRPMRSATVSPAGIDPRLWRLSSIPHYVRRWQRFPSGSASVCAVDGTREELATLSIAQPESRVCRGPSTVSVIELTVQEITGRARDHPRSFHPSTDPISQMRPFSDRVPIAALDVPAHAAHNQPRLPTSELPSEIDGLAYPPNIGLYRSQGNKALDLRVESNDPSTSSRRAGNCTRTRRSRARH